MKKLLTRIFVVCLLMVASIGFFACDDKNPKPTIEGYKATYYVDENFSANGATLKIYTSKDEFDEIVLTNDMVLQMPDMTTAGTKTVTIVYGEKEYKFEITVIGIASYEITGLNEVYKPGNNFSLDNAKLKLNYTDGNNVVINLTSSMLTTPPNMETAGKQDVKFTYNGKEYSTQINVMLLDHYEITGLKTEYIVGSTFDLTDAKLTIFYTDESKEEVVLTESMIKSKPNMNIQGLKTVEFKYNGYNYEYNFSVGGNFQSIQDKFAWFLSKYMAATSKGDVSVKVDYNMLASFLGDSVEKSETVLDENLMQSQINDKLLLEIYKAVVSAIVTEGTNFENILDENNLVAQLNIVSTLEQIVQNLKEVDYIDYVVHELILTEENSYYVNLITEKLCEFLNIQSPVGVGKTKILVTKYFNKFDKLIKIDVKELVADVYDLFKTYTEYDEKYVTLVDDILLNLQTIDVNTVGNIVKSVGKLTNVMKYQYQTLNEFEPIDVVVDYEIVTDEESLAVRDSFFECLADSYTAQIKFITSFDVYAYLNDYIDVLTRFSQTCQTLEENNLGIEFVDELQEGIYYYYDWETMEEKVVEFYYASDNYDTTQIDMVLSCLTVIKEVVDNGVVVTMKDHQLIETVYNAYIKELIPIELQQSLNINKLAGYAYDLMQGKEINIETFIVDVCEMFGMGDQAQTYITRYKETGKLNLIEDLVEVMFSNPDNELPQEMYDPFISLARYIDNTMLGEFDLTTFVGLLHDALVSVNDNIEFGVGYQAQLFLIQVGITLTDTSKSFEENVMLILDTNKEMVVASISNVLMYIFGIEEGLPDYDQDSERVYTFVTYYYESFLEGSFDTTAFMNDFLPFIEKYMPEVYEVIMGYVQVGTVVYPIVQAAQTIIVTIASGELVDMPDLIVKVCDAIGVDPTIYLDRYNQNGTLNILEDLANEYLRVESIVDTTELNNAILDIAKFLDNTMTGEFDLNQFLGLVNNLAKETDDYLTRMDLNSEDYDKYALKLVQAITDTTKTFKENIVAYLNRYDVVIQGTIVDLICNALSIDREGTAYDELCLIVATHYESALDGTFAPGELIGDVTNYIETYLSKDAATVMKALTSMFILLEAKNSEREIDYNEIFSFIELPKEFTIDYNVLIAKLLDENSYNDIFTYDNLTVQYVDDSQGNIVKEVITFNVYLDFDMMITSIDADATITLEINF